MFSCHSRRQIRDARLLSTCESGLLGLVTSLEILRIYKSSLKTLAWELDASRQLGIENSVDQHYEVAGVCGPEVSAQKL